MTLESWEMQAVETTGEMPGWIHGHRARYKPEQNSICIAGGEVHMAAEGGELKIIPNKDQFELDLSLFQWRRMK